MRFAQLINNRNPADIPLGELTGLVDGWLAKMASWRYTRDTRMEHVQQAMDQIYTDLERKMKTTSSPMIMSSDVWKAIVELVAKDFSRGGGSVLPFACRTTTQTYVDS